MDNLNAAYDQRLKRWRRERLEGRPGFTFSHLDIRYRDRLRELFRSGAGDSGAAFDAVVNLAARAGVRPTSRARSTCWSSAGSSG